MHIEKSVLICGEMDPNHTFIFDYILLYPMNCIILKTFLKPENKWKQRNTLEIHPHYTKKYTELHVRFGLVTHNVSTELH